MVEGQNSKAILPTLEFWFFQKRERGSWYENSCHFFMSFELLEEVNRRENKILFLSIILQVN